MSTFNRQISYDLREPGRNYEPLWTELKRFGAVRVLDSDWVLTSDHGCDVLRDHFLQFMDSNDGLLVTKVETWAAKGIGIKQKMATATT